jgi:hypothetical protein
MGGVFADAELLVISDGEDNAMDLTWLQNCLGKDIALHYVALGRSGNSAGAALQAVAKTFVEYN